MIIFLVINKYLFKFIFSLLIRKNEITVFRLNELSFLFVKKINVEKDIKNFISDLLLLPNNE